MVLREPGLSFDEILSDVVTDVFSLLGESVRQTISFHLEKSFDLKVQEIPRRPKDFAIALDSLLGAGANHLEDVIVQKLYLTLGYDERSGSQGRKINFEECVERAAQFCHSKVRPASVGES